ncbi:MAG: hypothetical protein QOH69_2422 [Actinomycetota bacterium]|nr:hypothetical protein [Actinomycetota bacterium]
MVQRLLGQCRTSRTARSALTDKSPGLMITGAVQPHTRIESNSPNILPYSTRLGTNDTYSSRAGQVSVRGTAGTRRRLIWKLRRSSAWLRSPMEGAHEADRFGVSREPAILAPHCASNSEKGYAGTLGFSTETSWRSLLLELRVTRKPMSSSSGPTPDAAPIHSFAAHSQTFVSTTRVTPIAGRAKTRLFWSHSRSSRNWYGSFVHRTGKTMAESS